jgi:hypothetical protein
MKTYAAFPNLVNYPFKITTVLLEALSSLMQHPLHNTGNINDIDNVFLHLLTGAISRKEKIAL